MENNYNPCSQCFEKPFCREMCKIKKDYLNFLEGDTPTFKVKKETKKKRKTVDVNKHGIRRETFNDR